MLTCLFCGQSLSENMRAVSCPRCGRPLSNAVARRPHRLSDTGGSICGLLGILAFFALPWEIVTDSLVPARSGAYPAWVLTTWVSGGASWHLALLWFVPLSGFLLALFGVLRLAGGRVAGRFLPIQLVGALVGLLTVASSFISMLAQSLLGPIVHIGLGCWIALLAFAGALALVMIDLTRPRRA